MSAQLHESDDSVTTQSSATASATRVGAAAPRIEVRATAPLLPRIAFVLLGVASLVGTALSNRGLGVPLAWLVPRWLALWSVAVSVGFLAWRVLYLRDEAGEGLDDYHADLRHRARRVGRVLGTLVLVAVPTVLGVGYLTPRAAVRVSLLAGALLLAVLLVSGVDERRRGWAAFVVAVGLTGAWSLADAGGGIPALWRGLHLLAFGLWVGGAAWNLAVAIPVGARHPTIDAVTSGALQLQRFRRVARVALPTIVLTGALMALPHVSTFNDLAATTAGRFITAKVLLIVTLVVIFITCPLFRQCSPVAGVCDSEDLEP